MNKGHNPIGELINSLRGLLSRFASREYAHPRADKKTGVLIEYNTVQRNMIAFSGTTHDRVSWRIKYDVNATSKEYIDNMVQEVRMRIETHRKKRQEESVIVLPGSLSNPRKGLSDAVSVAIEGTIQ